MLKTITFFTTLFFVNMAAFAQFDLQITEIFPGNEPGTNLTSDWFEITNNGTTAWVSGEDADLFYDDDSQDPTAADLINGITDIQPGERVIAIIGDANDVIEFTTIWSPAYDLSGIKIGYSDGSGLGQGGDGVTLFVGGPRLETLADFESFPDASATGGQSYDIELGAFSTVGNANNAAATFVLNDADQPAIGSPGNQGPLLPVVDLQISEIWPGNEPGSNLTSDWFEIVNNGSAAWVSGVDADLFYDDDSQDPTAADLINGITDIQPGERVIVIIGDAADVTEFTTVWSPAYNLTGIEIGYTDGSGLGGGGDGVTLFLGGPTVETIIDFESYPNADANGGQSYDVELGAFSSVLNASNAGATIALNDEAQPAIASPGNLGPLNLTIDLQITELWSGQSGDDLTADWFELYNAGSEAWVSGVSPDLWYDDVSASATDATLIEGITDIQPGESVIVMIGTSVDVTNFSDVWALDYDLTAVEIGYTDGAGLGGSDTVTLWLGDPRNSELLMDSKGYVDADANDGQSYDVVNMDYSINGGGAEAPGTNVAVATSTLGGNLADTPAVGSPGNKGPLDTVIGAPEIEVDIAALTPYLDLSEQGPSSVSGVVGDPTDPAATIGIPFRISDDGATVSLSAVSSATTVVAEADVVLTPAFDPSVSDYVLTLSPTALGFSTITLTVTDNDANATSYIINYAASEASVVSSTSRYYTGSSDGSTAIPVDSDYMWVGDDEDQTLRLYNRTQSGLPLTEIDFNNDLGSTAEIDIEGSIREGNTLYWIGSTASAARSVLFATTISGSGATSTLSYVDKYSGLRDDLLNGGFGLPSNFEIEALAFAPNSTTAYLGFRVPDNSNMALIIPVTNFTALPGASAGSATFGTPITLNLGGRTLRSLECNAEGCILIGGPHGTTASDFKIYTWSGNETDTPEMRSADLESLNTGGSFEGIISLPEVAFQGAAGDAVTIDIMSDLGATVIYSDGTENKDQRRAWKKFRTDVITLGEVEVLTEADPLINEFVADHVGGDTEAFIEILGDPNTDYSAFTLLEIEGDSGTSTGSIDAVKAIGTTDDNGYWLDNEDAENGSVTFLIVEGFTGAVGDDLDTDDDGVLDQMPWARLVDGVGTSDGGEGDLVYAVVLAPSFDGNENQVGGASRIPNGVDTDTTSDWVRNDFDGAGLPALDPGTPEIGEAINTPGAQNQIVTPPLPILQITEIWPGNEPGSNLTSDWFEITNTGTVAWTSNLGGLYFDDDSQDPASATLISGITSIAPGEVVIAIDDEDTSEFLAVWEPSYNLSGIQIGTYAGAGLGQGGDGVTLWIGDPLNLGTLADFESYPDANLNGGQSYDVNLAAFSVVGNANNAAATALLNDAGQASIGSPGNQGSTVSNVDIEGTELKTEIYPVPFDNVLHISMSIKSPVDVTFNLYNILGALVVSEKKSILDGTTSINNLSNLPSGIYILNIPELQFNRQIIKR